MMMSYLNVGDLGRYTGFELYIVDILAVFFLSGGQAYLLSHWHGARFREPLFQALHGVWSVGAAVGPFLIKAFLVPIYDQELACATAVPLYNYDYITISTSQSISSEPLSDCNITASLEPPDVERVRYGFAIIAAVNLLASLSFYAIFFIQKPFCFTKRDNHLAKKNTDHKKEDTRYKIILLFMLYWFFFLYLWAEDLPGAFLSILAVKGLKWDVRLASVVTSVFWGCHCIGRLISIPISSRFSARQMLVTALVLTAISFLLMSLFAEEYDFVIVVTSGLAGLSMSCVFASCVLWASQYIWISGIAAGVVLIGASSGALTASPVAAYLSQTYSYMWIAYLPFLASVANIALYAGMQLFALCYPQKSEETARNIDQEELKPINVDVDNEKTSALPS